MNDADRERRREAAPDLHEQLDDLTTCLFEHVESLAKVAPLDALRAQEHLDVEGRVDDPHRPRAERAEDRVAAAPRGLERRAGAFSRVPRERAPYHWSPPRRPERDADDLASPEPSRASARRPPELARAARRVQQGGMDRRDEKLGRESPDIATNDTIASDAELSTDDTVAADGATPAGRGDNLATDDTIAVVASAAALRLANVGEQATELAASPNIAYAGTLAATDHGRRERGPLRRGEAVGRLTILRMLGAGGMGVVYAAYDPELDRKVALKLLRGESSETARTRLYREARALARLTHPNIVAVHDVGTHKGQVWVAMEFVEGRTLARWREEEKPSWRQIVDVVKQASRGVAAAHKQGLLHRDLKPENIMVGADGRVRVMDFGLVGTEASRGPARPPAGMQRALSVELTEAGAVMGTPAYMAPEQFLGLTATERTDVFALSATLWEALYGERAFAGTTFGALRSAVTTGTRRPAPAGARVPAWVRRVAERGLQLDAEQRHASADALLAALESDPRPRRWALGLTAGTLGVAAATVTVQQVQHRRAVAACSTAASSIDEIWNEGARADVARGLESTGVSYASVTAERVTPWLDAYAEDWRRTREAVCLAETVDGRWASGARQDETFPKGQLATHAEACVEDGRERLRSLIEQLGDPGEAGAAMVQRAVQAASALPGLEACLDEGRLRHRPTPPAGEEAREEVRRLRRELAKASTLQATGRYEQGLSLAEDVQGDADELGWAPLRAAAALRRGSLLDNLGKYESAQAAVEEAYVLAARSGADEVCVDAALKRAWVVGYRRAQHSEGALWSALGEAQLDRAGVGADDVRRASLLNIQGVVASAAGRLEEASGSYEEALEIRERALGSEHPDVADALNNLGNVAYTDGRYNEATRSYERALGIREKALGSEHPSVAMSLNNLGNVAHGEGRYADAAGYYGRALGIWEEALGREHPNVADTLNNLGEVAYGEGRYEDASGYYQRALGIREEALGSEHPSVADSLNSLGNVAYSEGRYEEATGYYERALGIREKALGSEHPDVAMSLNNLGSVAMAAGRYEEAAGDLERALGILEKALGRDHRMVAYLLTGLGAARVHQEQHASARELLERALTIHARSNVDAVALADTRFALARALWPDPGQRQRARALAEQAGGAYREAGAHKAKKLAEVDEWQKRNTR
ncbi:MAG: tetratricopeptide repeat protein [Myxococcales bacterium]|nr:tetratricopeptide repeat protein [Myxococcales bacterium]MCB9750954.1 tetratricopeptide repeat protein [Myxococcales bacterium]